MANLNSWQKISRVVSGKPFGDGSDGSYSSATIPTITKDSCSGSSGSTTLTTAGSTFSNGDVILIHQSRGTGVGQWEINKVASGGGTTSLTLQEALQYTFTDSGASQAQAVKIHQYTDVTVETGTWTIPSWNGDTGGIFPVAASGTITVTGTISGDAAGFDGGLSVAGLGDATMECGENTSADSTVTNSAVATGGGGAIRPGGGAAFNDGGGGGGHGTTGGDGEGATNGGAVGGSADLITLVFGGGGGGAYAENTGSVTQGGNSAGIAIFFGKDIVVNGNIYLRGETGGSALTGNETMAGGGGSGGGVLLQCETATLGTSNMVATGGAAGTAGGTDTKAGGAGGVGRIAVHHSGTVTGTSNPTFTDVTDSSLVEASGNAILFSTNF